MFTCDGARVLPADGEDGSLAEEDFLDLCVPFTVGGCPRHTFTLRSLRRFVKPTLVAGARFCGVAAPAVAVFKPPKRHAGLSARRGQKPRPLAHRISTTQTRQTHAAPGSYPVVKAVTWGSPGGSVG